MIKTVWLGAAAALVLSTAGCGSDDSSSDEGIGTAETAAEQAVADVDPNSPVCSPDGTPGMQSLALGIQLLAQPSLNTVLAVRDGEAGFAELYDIDAMRAGIEDFRELEGRPADGYDDPQVVLDKWEDLTDRMDAMINGASEPTQADIDAYTTAMGEPQDLIMSQLDVSLARDSYCS